LAFRTPTSSATEGSFTRCCCIALAALVTTLFFWGWRVFSRRWWLLFGYFFMLAASHGMLDALTSGGLGIALFSPFDNTRYFFPVTPIEVSPLGVRAFFSEWGLRVMVSEIFWVWLPAVAAALLVRVCRHCLRPKTSSPGHS
jgi:inner membrane protein